ncbi:hypothetical protein JTE90_014325 [Oedothorax gibbosus]|uniref:RRM domain-containing protein n=1 Tax=Oedothorax gibbosus TaxID=931172 RepID=A0AAV6UW90_9ARAC|nr:hypothetical protein JTE90_014325 [Oedothorax gibbosus]
MADRDIDLYADDYSLNQSADYKNCSEVDLYNDAITAPMYTYDFKAKSSVTSISPTHQSVTLNDDAITGPFRAQNFKGKSSVSDISPFHQSVEFNEDAVAGLSRAYNFKNRPSVDDISPSHQRVAVYVGNLTWWTTDEDLTGAMASLGAKDIYEIEFYAYRSNGQSKGFCTVALGSEDSLRIVMQELPRIQLHGRNPIVTPCTWQNRDFFESISDERLNRKRRRGRDDGDMRQEKRYMYEDDVRIRSNSAP